MAVSDLPDDLLRDHASVHRSESPRVPSAGTRGETSGRSDVEGPEDRLVVRAGAVAEEAARRLDLPAPGATLAGLGALPPVEVPALGDETAILRARPTTKEEPKLAVRVLRDVGHTELVIFVPPAFDGAFELAGEGWSRRVRVSHPVSRPLAPPNPAGPTAIESHDGDPVVVVRAEYLCHHASTGRLDLMVAGPGGQLRLASAVVDPAGTEPTRLQARYDLGQLRAGVLDLWVNAVSRFTADFAEGECTALSSPRSRVVVPDRTVRSRPTAAR